MGKLTFLIGTPPFGFRRTKNKILYYNNLLEIYALEYRINTRFHSEGGWIFFKDVSAKWYAIGVPYKYKLKDIITKLQFAFGPRWHEVFSGIRKWKLSNFPK